MEPGLGCPAQCTFWTKQKLRGLACCGGVGHGTLHNLSDGSACPGNFLYLTTLDNKLRRVGGVFVTMGAPYAMPYDQLLLKQNLGALSLWPKLGCVFHVTTAAQHVAGGCSTGG
eukprot:1148437-Pelagomonas_calceolata.AAC.2